MEQEDDPSKSLQLLSNSENSFSHSRISDDFMDILHRNNFLPITFVYTRHRYSYRPISLNIPIFELNSDEVSQPQIMERGENPGTILELVLNAENHYRQLGIPDEILNTFLTNEDAEHVRIICTDNYEDHLSGNAKREVEFLTALRQSIMCLSNLKTLYLETHSNTSIAFWNPRYLEVHPKLGKVTVFNRINRDQRDVVHVHVKQVEGDRSIDFHGINLCRKTWSVMIEVRSQLIKNIEELDVVGYSTVSRISLSLPIANFLKLLRVDGFFMSKEEFHFICTNCRKLDTLIVHIRDKIFFSDFCSVKRLNNLRNLVLKMEYDFSRQVLTLVLKQSEFSQLNVVIIELQRDKSPELVTLKNGLITVKFLGKYESYSGYEPAQH